LPDAQLRILGKENLGDKDFVGREIARRDRFVVFDVFLRIDQDRPGFLGDRMIVGPLREDCLRGVPQINFDTLVGRKIERDGALGLIGQRQFDVQLAGFRQLRRLRRDQQLERETEQLRVFVLRIGGRGKWMEDSAEPASLLRRRGGCGLLSKHTHSNREHQNKGGNASSHERVNSKRCNSCQTLYQSAMKMLCATILSLLLALPAGVAKDRHCMFRLHAEANPHDTAVFATSVPAQFSGKDIAIERMPRISERDVAAFYPYSAGNGTYGALFQLDDHGRIALDALSIERRGSLLFAFINGRPITELEIDKRVADGKIYIASGLTAADVDSMKKDWRLIGQHK